jgi:hypothetical protein
VPEASVSFSLNFDTVGFWKILEIFFFWRVDWKKKLWKNEKQIANFL